MGRYWGFGKSTTFEYCSVDVRDWQRRGLLDRGNRFTWEWSRDGEKIASIGVCAADDAVVLDYRSRRPGEDWRDVEDHIWLNRTECHLGGERIWFQCPGCGRRCAKLYLAGRARCRQCLNLAYESQRENRSDRSLRKAQNIRRQLGGSASLLEHFPGKPKGMHWRTYWRLRDKAEVAEGYSLAYLSHWVKRHSEARKRS